jgi:hypothetical protein
MSYIDSGVVYILDTATGILGCLHAGAFQVQNGAVVVLDYDTLVQGGAGFGVRARRNCELRIGAAAFFDATGPGLLIKEGGAVFCDVFLSGNNLLWGTGSSTVGVQAQSESGLVYTVKPTVTGATDTTVGGTAKTWAQIPYIEPANNAYIVLNA